MAVIDRRLKRDKDRYPSIGDYVINEKGDVYHQRPYDLMLVGSIENGYLVPANSKAKYYLEDKIAKENNTGNVIKTFDNGYKIVTDKTYAAGGLLDQIKKDYKIKFDDILFEDLQKKCGIIETGLYPKTFNPMFIPWWDVKCNPLKSFPDDGEIHINVKRHNIKFNFKN